VSKDDRGKVDIPDEWKVESLGNLFEFYGGMPFSRAALGDSGFLYLHYGDIHKRGNGKFDVAKDSAWLPRVDISIDEVKETALLHDGDLVFADASEDYDGIGKSVVIENKSGETFVSGLHTIIAKGSRKELDLNYKRYFLSPPFVRSQFIQIATGATVYGISKANIKKINVLVPPISEQRKIAAILTSVDEAIEKTEAIIEQTEKVKKGLMQRLLTKGIGHTRFKKTEVGEIPEEWDLKPLSAVLIQMTDYVANGSFQSLKENVNVYDHTEYAYYIRLYDLRLGIGHDRQKFVDEESYTFLIKSSLFGNELLIANIGANVGEVFIMPKLTKPATIAPNMVVMRVNPENNYEYIYYYLSSNLGQMEIRKEISGSGQPKLNKTGLKKVLVPCPVIEEQNGIAAALSAIDQKILVERGHLSALLTVKRALMQVLLTGKVRAKIDEQAEVVNT